MLRICRPTAAIFTSLPLHAVPYGSTPYIEGYQTLKEATQICETTVKDSKFLTRAWPIENVEEAKQFIKENSDKKASHNCFAYKLEFESKYSDDGEPGGTGGRPIFRAIETENIDHVCVLVTRYFGGTKLGVGPLGRAYADAARQCLKSVEAVVVQPTVDGEMRMPYDSMFKLHAALKRFKGKILTKEYFDDICAALREFGWGGNPIEIKNRRRPY